MRTHVTDTCIKPRRRKEACPSHSLCLLQVTSRTNAPYMLCLSAISFAFRRYALPLGNMLCLLTICIAIQQHACMSILAWFNAGAVKVLAMSADCSLLATAAQDSTVFFFRVASPIVYEPVGFFRLQQPAACLTFSSDSTKLLIGCRYHLLSHGQCSLLRTYVYHICTSIIYDCCQDEINTSRGSDCNAVPVAVLVTC